MVVQTDNFVWLFIELCSFTCVLNYHWFWCLCWNTNNIEIKKLTLSLMQFVSEFFISMICLNKKNVLPRKQTGSWSMRGDLFEYFHQLWKDGVGNGQSCKQFYPAKWRGKLRERKKVRKRVRDLIILLLSRSFFTPPRNCGGVIFLLQFVCLSVCLWTKFQPNECTVLDAVFAKRLLRTLHLLELYWIWWPWVEGQGHWDRKCIKKWWKKSLKFNFKYFWK